MFPFRHCRRLYGALGLKTNYVNKFYGNGLRYHYSTLPASFQRTSVRQPVIRNYVRQATTTCEISCWNCKKSTTLKNDMFCAECGLLQDVNSEMNYFELLDCPQRFNVEQQVLTRRFRQLQAIVHPDKYSNKSEREQSNSADWSSLINKAYKTLSTPIERGQYLLQLHNLQIPEDNSALDKEFLIEMMERNEEVDDATTEDELRQLDERINKEMQSKSSELIIQFDDNDLKGAIGTLVQMKYLRSLQRSIKSKLQSLMF